MQPTLDKVKGSNLIDNSCAASLCKPCGRLYLTLFFLDLHRIFCIFVGIENMYYLLI